MPLLHAPLSRIAPAILFFTRKWKWWNSTKTLFCLVRWWTEIKFLQRFGTQRVSCNVKVRWGECKSKKPMCETTKLEPLLRITLSIPSYSEWIDKLERSPVILWEMVESSNQILSLPVEIAAQLMEAFYEWSWGQNFAVWPNWS